MLTVERLICKDRKYHKNCHWIKSPIQYPDELLPHLIKQLKKIVMKRGIARRIIHDKQGTIITIKRGNDLILWCSPPKTKKEVTLIKSQA